MINIRCKKLSSFSTRSTVMMLYSLQANLYISRILGRINKGFEKLNKGNCRISRYVCWINTENLHSSPTKTTLKSSQTTVSNISERLKNDKLSSSCLQMFASYYQSFPLCLLFHQASRQLPRATMKVCYRKLLHNFLSRRSSDIT